MTSGAAPRLVAADGRRHQEVLAGQRPQRHREIGADAIAAGIRDR